MDTAPAELAPDGTLTRTQSFDVYGGVRTSSGTATSQHKFVGSLGHPSEDATGLIYMRARWMDPVTGRFVSEDLARSGANWYAYCSGNPTNGVDADGKEPNGLPIERWLESSAGHVLIAVSLLLLRSIAIGGFQRAPFIFAFILAMGGIALIADALKDVALGNAAATAVISALTGFGMNMLFNSLNGKGTYLKGGILPALGNVLAAFEAMAVIEEVYILTIT